MTSIVFNSSEVLNFMWRLSNEDLKFLGFETTLSRLMYVAIHTFYLKGWDFVFLSFLRHVDLG